MRMKLCTLGIVLAALVAAMVAAGCGGGDGVKPDANESGPTAPIPEVDVEASPPVVPSVPAPPTSVPDPAPDPAPVGNGDPDAPPEMTKSDEMMLAYLASFEEMKDVFATVTDEASAISAGESLRGIVDQMKKLEPEWKALPKADLVATSARYRQDVSRIQLELAQATIPVMMNPTYGRHVKDAMTGMPSFPSGR